MKKIIIILFCFSLPYLGISQNVGIGTATPLDKLHVIGNIRSSTLSGVGNRMVLSDLNGTLVNATGITSPAWMTTGNSLTLATTNFLGTIDAVDFVIRSNNIERIRTLSNGQVSVNNAVPFANVVFSSYAAGAFDAIDGAAQGTGDGVYGQNTSAGATPGFGVNGISTAATGIGTAGYNLNATGTGILGVGNNLPGGYAVAGSGGAFTGARIGIYSVSNNIAAATSSTGIIGRDAGGTFTMLNGGAGVTGSAANSGVAMFAYNTGISNLSHGLYSSITSTTASAVLAFGVGSGVQGQSTGINGAGVSGFSTGTGSFGVYGSAGADGDGVYGTATGALGYGVTGFVTNGNSAIGVYGYADANGPARFGGFFDNDLGSSGTKSFMIDHPLDPANKYLKHFSIESPEVLNVYRGNIVLNSNGEATVTLPTYFDAVNNTNYSYNLTPVGAPAQLYIKSEISNKQFVIAGGASGMKVSWTVYSERNDPYLQQYPDERTVEVNKSGAAIGKYVSPALYGQPLQSGIFYKNQHPVKAQPKQMSNEESESTRTGKVKKDFSPIESGGHE
jgi:hypothetical protein